MAFHSPSPRKMGRQEGKIKKKQHQPWVVPWLCPSWAQSPRAERGEGFAGWQKELTPGTAFPRMAGLDRVQEVSSPFGATAGACIACLEITRAGSRSGLLLSSPHLPFPSALPSLGPNTLLFLSPHPTSEHHAGVNLCCVSQFSSAHSLSSLLGPHPPGQWLSTVTVHSCCVPQEAGLCASTAIHQLSPLFPLHFWQPGANLDTGFPHCPFLTPFSITLEKALQIHSSPLSCV